jgi:microcin C transport system substrate-binding protein
MLTIPSRMKYPCLALAPLVLLALSLGGCGKSSPSAATAAAPSPSATPATDAAPAPFSMEADLQKTLKAEPDFYVFKKASDFEADTKGLKWDDSSDLPEFADLAAKKGGTLSYYADDFPGTLRVLGPDSNGTFRAYLLDYVALSFIETHPNFPGRCFPELASAWAIDAANRTVYFKIDPDARWSDGVPLTTDDVVFSWYMYRSPHLDDPWSNDFYHKTYSRLTIYDARTFAVTIPELRPDILVRAGNVNPWPKHAFADFGPGWVQRHNWVIPPTLGAYTIKDEDIKRTSSITLSHVPNWWGANKRFQRGRYNPDRIRLTIIHDPDKAFEAFVRGDIDMFPLSTPQWYEKLKNDGPEVMSGFTVKAVFYHEIPTPNFGLWINEALPILDDVNVRVGIAYASNFDLVCRQYFRGDAQVQKTESDGYGWDVNPAVHPYPFDPEKARASFAKAGFAHEGPDGILSDAKGRRLSFTVTTIYKRYQDVLVILKQEALKAGLELNLEVLDMTTGFEKESEKKAQISLTALQRTVEMYPRYWDFFDGVNAYDVPYLKDGSPNPNRKVKTSTVNLSEIADPHLDELIAQYDKAETMEQVKDLSAKMEQILHDNAGWVNGWKVPFFRVGYRPWIKWPADFNPKQALDFEQYWLMWIDPDAQKEALAAKAAGKSLPPQVLTFDKYKEP